MARENKGKLGQGIYRKPTGENARYSSNRGTVVTSNSFAEWTRLQMSGFGAILGADFSAICICLLERMRALTPEAWSH